DFTVTNASPTIAALFLPLAPNQVTLTALSDGFGRVVTAPAANVYTNGQTVTLTAAPGLGQQFLGWSGSFSGSQNPVTVLLTNSESVTAQFTRKLSLSAEAILLQNGTIGARITVNGPAANHEVQTSPDWTAWSKFGTLSLPTGEAQFIDSVTTGIPQRF